MRKSVAFHEAGCTQVPEPLAEYLPPHIAIAAMKQFETRRNPEGLFRSAWHNVEFALNRSIELDDAVRISQLDGVQALLGKVLVDQTAHEDTKLGALMLSSYIPIFAKRACEMPISRQDCQALYVSLGRAMQHIRPANESYPPPSLLTEIAVLAASTRMQRPDFLLYPTSPREESSAIAQLNHDSYFLSGDKKIPLQHKTVPTDHEYDDWIRIITLEPIMKKAYKKSRIIEPKTSTAQLNHMIALIIAETSGERLTKNELDFMNVLSEAIAYHYVHAE